MGLFNMFPSFAYDYVGNVALCNAEHFGNEFLARASGPVNPSNISNIVFGENRMWKLVSSGYNISTLGDHIGYVIFRGTKKKMIWANAFRIVTKVTNHSPGWNPTLVNFVTKSMRTHRGPVKSHLSVSIGSDTTNPLPTGVHWGNKYVIPKTVSYRTLFHGCFEVNYEPAINTKVGGGPWLSHN